MNRNILLSGILISLASGAWAQDVQIVSHPELGILTSSPAGGEIYSIEKIYSIEGVQLNAEARTGSWLVELEMAPKGAQLIAVKGGEEYKACVPEAGTVIASATCLIDEDRDGKFEAYSMELRGKSKKLRAPVPYNAIRIGLDAKDDLKRVILYQGASSDSLRFSYREFKNDMARPAFTEELVIPREKLPAMIMIKNIQMEIISVTGMGLQYRIDKVY